MTTMAKDVMKTNVISVSPETSVLEIAKVLVDNGVSGVPVVTKHKEILGVVSEESLLYKLAK
ncbi:MAG: CBS domain-containing protein, partial [Schwartzia sp.]|nr:CBS domain-containing protein [Schwartzia sp. (in: firmicutes)]